MFNKISAVLDLMKEVDTEDIKALRNFVLVVKCNGLSVVTALRKIISEFEVLTEELRN